MNSERWILGLVSDGGIVRYRHVMVLEVWNTIAADLLLFLNNYAEEFKSRAFLNQLRGLCYFQGGREDQMIEKDEIGGVIVKLKQSLSIASFAL